MCVYVHVYCKVNNTKSLYNEAISLHEYTPRTVNLLHHSRHTLTHTVLLSSASAARTETLAVLSGPLALIHHHDVHEAATCEPSRQALTCLHVVHHRAGMSM